MVFLGETSLRSTSAPLTDAVPSPQPTATLSSTAAVAAIPLAGEDYFQVKPLLRWSPASLTGSVPTPQGRSDISAPSALATTAGGGEQHSEVNGFLNPGLLAQHNDRLTTRFLSVLLEMLYRRCSLASSLSICLYLTKHLSLFQTCFLKQDITMASTGWKHNAETLAIEYKREQDRVADLRRRLAEKEELLVAALSGQPPPTGHARSSSQVDELLLLVQTKDETIAKLSRAVAQADDQLQNNFGKITKIEQDAELQSVRLQRKLDEAAQELAKERSANAPTNIHWELREEITCLKNDIVFLKNENKQLRDDLRQHKAIDQNPLQGTELKKLRDMNASLMRQLQVEKRANTDELPFMRSDSAKLDEDDDDDEELPYVSCHREL